MEMNMTGNNREGDQTRNVEGYKTDTYGMEPFKGERRRKLWRKRFRGNGPKFHLRERIGVNIYVLPNLITTCNMFSGFVGIIYAIKGEFVFSAYALIAAAVFDLLDGRVARLTNSTSQFGMEYDSLSDLVSFGMAPGILIFLWALQPFGRIGWLASFLYVACGALRLARFNVQAKLVEKKDFTGLPIPMAAGIIAGAVLTFQELNLEGARNWGLLFMTFLLAFVMVSNFRYRSFKDFDLKERLPFRYLVIGVLLLVVIASRPEVMLFILFLTYATLGAVFGIWNIGKKKENRAHKSLAEEEERL